MNERHKQFLKELADLLEKYGVIIDTSDKYAWLVLKDKNDEKQWLCEFSGTKESIENALKESNKVKIKKHITLYDYKI